MTIQLTLKQLRYLCTLAKTCHFGEAAEKCHVSQSTLSAAITELEEHLGLTLFERNNKRVSLTSVGEEVVHRSQDILAKVNDLVSLCHASHKPFTSELQLGVIPTIAPFLLPALLNQMRSEYPDLKFMIREDISGSLLRHLLDGHLDLLIMALPYPSQGTETLPLFYDDFLLACPNDHPLASKTAVTLQDLKEQDLLLLEDGHCLRDHALEACKLRGNEISIPYQATSLNTLIQMVANGLGITLLPKMAVDSHILAGIPVTVRPFVEKNVRRGIGLIWRKTSPRQDEFRLLGEILKQQHSPAVDLDKAVESNS